MEAVPRMPMIWLDLKEAGDFQFSPSVRQFILKNYGENPDNYNEQLKKLEALRQSAVNVTRDFEGCSTLRKYFGQLHYLQTRVPLGPGQEAAVPISWTEIFSGKTVTHDDISYEQACILYNLGALHSMLGAMDNRVSEEGMKVSCTHFQCSAGAFSYLRDHFSHNFSVDMSHQILNLNINLMLGQAQECLLEKSMLDNRKSFLVARISAQVVDYYKEACRALDNSDTASMLGKIQKDWKKLVQMKIYYFAAIAHLHMGKQAEEQQKFGERLAYLQSSLDKLNEAIKLAKGQPDSVLEALRFTMDVIGGKFNAAKKDNDFIYHETVPSLETLASVKGAPLVKALPVNPTDPSVTGPDLFAKLVPMAAHEASSLYSEEKAKLLRDIMAKIDIKNETLEQFMDSLGLEPDSVDNLDMYTHIPPVLMEKCAALSVRPDTVKSLVQAMQALSGVFTDVEASLREIQEVLQEDAAAFGALQGSAPGAAAEDQALADIRRDLEKYLEVHTKASFTNTELHRAMNLHISNLRLLGGPLDSLREALPRPQLNEEEQVGLQCVKRILGKVQEMRDQRTSLEKQLRDLIQQDDITSSLVTTNRADIKRLFEDQLKKYEQVKVYIDQNLSAQENILKALTEANVQYASVRKGLSQVEQQWNNMVQTLVASYEAYEDLMKKSQEGKDFYEDLDAKASRLLERAKALCHSRKERKALLDRDMPKKPPARPTAAKPSALQPKGSDGDSACSSLEDAELAQLTAAIHALGGDLPEELRSLPPDLPSLPTASSEARLPSSVGVSTSLPWSGATGAGLCPPSFPANLPSPEFLACLAQYPTAGVHPNLTGPRTPFPQMPSRASASSYGISLPQASPPVRPSTTTVDSIQTPIPSFTPGPLSSVPPAVSGGYAMPLHLGSYPQISPHPGMPMPMPGQVHHPQPPQHHFPPPSGHQHYPEGMSTPRPSPQAQLGYPHGYMASPLRPAHQQYQPQFPSQLQHGYNQPQQGYRSQHPEFMQRPPQSQMSPHVPPHPHMPPNAQPPVLYMNSANQHIPPQTPHQQRGMLPMHSSAPQMAPYPHPCVTQSQPGCRLQMSPSGQPISYMPPGVHPQMPSWPLTRGPLPHPGQMPLPAHPGQMPLPAQHHPAHPGQMAHIPQQQQQSMQRPAQPQNSGPDCYHGGTTMTPPQTLTPQPPQAAIPTAHSLHPPAAMLYPGAPGSNVPAGVPPQATCMDPAVSSGPTPQHNIQPPPGAPTVTQPPQPPNVIPISSSPSPSPGPSAHSMVPTQGSSSEPNPGAPSFSSAASPSTSLFSCQNSSTDDLLSSSPESQPGGPKASANVLLPTKADPQDRESRKTSQGILLIQGDPYQAPERVTRLYDDIESYRTKVESLEHPSAQEGSMSVLDAQWKELQDQQEKDARQLSIAIARCYTMKNRHQDVMPYDANRVVLRSGKDDYINGSYVEGLSPYCPQVIATQAPLSGTAADFWLMVYEQKVSLVVMLVSEQELEKGKVLRYFPVERGQQLSQGPISLTLTAQKTTPTHVERMIGLQYRDQSLKRTVIHLQFNTWPELGLPESTSCLMRFIQEVHGHYLHQRPLHMPVIVHCSSGVGRTGAFCLLYAALQEVEAGNGIPDLPLLVKKMRQQRKNMLQEKLHLKFCYEAVLKHGELLLQRHGIPTATCSKATNTAVTKPYSRQESQQDLVLGSDMPISSIQATIAKLSIRAPSVPDQPVDGDLGELPAQCSPSDLSLEEVAAPSTSIEPLPSTSPPIPSSADSPTKILNGLNPVSPSPANVANQHTAPEALLPSDPPLVPPAQSSLELLASLTPEAFSMEGGGKGKQRVTKQSFLQPSEGHGLKGLCEEGGDDPLSSLDPLWSLNKS
ncbi:tyrosine-protein phosphatase non-receptor type 23 [Aplochiton taeniatus]